MQVRETTRPFTISTDYRKLEAQDPLHRIAARTHCIKPGCNGKYRIPFIVKNSTRSNVGKAYQEVSKQYSTRSIQSNSGQCYTCGSSFIHHYMAAIPPTEHNGVPSQPPAAPSQYKYVHYRPLNRSHEDVQVAAACAATRIAPMAFVKNVV
jgi:hypothetical protein